MAALYTFGIAFVFSFVGSVPPGTLNLTSLQLGLSRNLALAWKFSIAAALVEYPYAWIAISFAELIKESPVIVENMKLVTAVVMLAIGGLSLWSAQRPTSFSVKFEQSGFRRGFILSILNPMAIPFWVAITAYLDAQNLIQLSSSINLHAYLLGVSLGALALLMLVAFLSSYLIKFVKSDRIVRNIPGVVLTVLGLYALFQYLR